MNKHERLLVELAKGVEHLLRRGTHQHAVPIQSDIKAADKLAEARKQVEEKGQVPEKQDW